MNKRTHARSNFGKKKKSNENLILTSKNKMKKPKAFFFLVKSMQIYPIMHHF